MQRFARYLGAAWLSVAVALLLVTVATVLCQVAFRYVLALPLAWTEEVARISLVCAVYAALPPAYLKGDHIVVDFFMTLLPKRLLFFYVLLLKAVCIFVLLYFALGAFLQAEATHSMTFISLPSVPVSIMYVVQGAALLSFAFLVLVTWRSTEVYVPLEHEGLDA